MGCSESRQAGSAACLHVRCTQLNKMKTKLITSSDSTASATTQSQTIISERRNQKHKQQQQQHWKKQQIYINFDKFIFVFILSVILSTNKSSSSSPQQLNSFPAASANHYRQGNNNNYHISHQLADYYSNNLNNGFHIFSPTDGRAPSSSSLAPSTAAPQPVTTSTTTSTSTTTAALINQQQQQALGLSGNHQQQQQQNISNDSLLPLLGPSMSCPNGLLTFELSTGFIYKPTSAETLAMLPSTLQLTDCLEFCLHNSSCLAINFEMGLCVLLSSSAKQNPANLYSSQFPVYTFYAEKKCLLSGK